MVIRVKYMIAGLTTKVAGMGLVNRRTDRQPSRTTCCAAEQTAENRNGKHTQRTTVAPCARSRVRGSQDGTSDATYSGGCSLSAMPRYYAQRVTTWAR